MSVDADRTVNLCNSFHDMWRFQFCTQSISPAVLSVIHLHLYRSKSRKTNRLFAFLLTINCIMILIVHYDNGWNSTPYYVNYYLNLFIQNILIVLLLHQLASANWSCSVSPLCASQVCVSFWNSNHHFANTRLEFLLLFSSAEFVCFALQ